jgi:hypothetical protein
VVSKIELDPLEESQCLAGGSETDASALQLVPKFPPLFKDYFSLP